MYLFTCQKKKKKSGSNTNNSRLTLVWFMLYSMMAERQSKRIAAKQACQRDLSPPAVPQSKKKAKTNYENVKVCIERMKQNNPEEYEACKENMKNASRLYRQNMSEEQRSRACEQAKIRMQNYRQQQNSMEQQVMELKQ